MVWLFKKPKPAGTEARTCLVDFSLSDESASVVALLRRVIPEIEGHSDSKAEVVVQLTGEYLGPFAAAVLYANYLRAQHDGRPHRLVLPTSTKAAAFAKFSGLDHRVNGGPPPDTRHPDNVTVPLMVVGGATATFTDPAIELVRRHVVLTEDEEIYLRGSVNEVIQNVSDHAASPIGATYCARYLSAPKKVRIAIVDRGLGIGTTLIRKHPEVQDVDAALRRVVKGGISAKSKPNNMGLGISNLWNFVTTQLRGHIFVITEDTIGYSEKNGRLVTEPLDVYFPGTGVFFSVPVADKEK